MEVVRNKNEDTACDCKAFCEGDGVWAYFMVKKNSDIKADCNCINGQLVSVDEGKGYGFKKAFLGAMTQEYSLILSTAVQQYNVEAQAAAK
eukprot:TRINITY_DN6288_c0_g1_i1.p3 TRINITY_DN6288_c0_g1~~TRINITY_DN6288_c0_g1_i1.p3  ORF type:complete len:91 (-),score=24.78 TRINITY_DN6288_c0_g1_i1:66-338(-)